MQHLNIPLSRHTKTTRRNRQVVWLMAFILLVAAFVVFRLGTMWFSRGSILDLAPSDTVLALELHLNKSTTPFLRDWLKGVPLISNRSLELSDLSPYIHGELAVFVTKQGDRSVAIRSTQSELPGELLGQYGISAQEQGAFVLLSSSLAPITGVDPLVRRPFLPSLGESWLGRVVFTDVSLGGNLFLSKSELTVKVETPRGSTSDAKGFQNASIVLGGLSWAEAGSPLGGLERLVTGLLGESKGIFLQTNTSMDLVVRQNESSLETLLIVKGSEADSASIIEELELIGAFSRPTVVTQTLADGTKLEEILVQPELVSVEEISTSLGQSYRVPTGGGSSILAAEHEGNVLFSNSQQLLEDYTSQLPSNQDDACLGSSNQIDPLFLLGQIHLDALNPLLGLLDGIFDDFSSVSVEFKKYSTNVHLCRI